MESNQTQLNKFELFEFFDRAEEYFARCGSANALNSGVSPYSLTL